MFNLDVQLLLLDIGRSFILTFQLNFLKEFVEHKA